MSSNKTYRAWRARPIALLVHRYVGLVIAVFLTIAGLTGSMMAFYGPLDAALNPELYRVAVPADGRAVLAPLVLHTKIQAQFPEEQIQSVILERTPGRSVNYWIQEQETFVDPYSGAILGRRTFGDLAEGRKNLLTFLYRLHYSLALGELGTWLMGVVALLWTLDCFVGAYLTFPGRGPTQRGAGPSWLRRWLPMWKVQTRALFAGIFTWHRASGLWVWGVLLVFAWSAVGLNLHNQVYAPTMGLVLSELPDPERPEIPGPHAPARLALDEALATGRRLMAAEAKRRGFQVLSERWLADIPEHGIYSYTVDSTLDIEPRLADTTLAFDRNSGEFVSFRASTGQDARGTVDAWLVALHFGAVRELGNAYRVFVLVLGLMVSALSITGLWIWWRKRTRRVR